MSANINIITKLGLLVIDTIKILKNRKSYLELRKIKVWYWITI